MSCGFFDVSGWNNGQKSFLTINLTVWKSTAVLLLCVMFDVSGRHEFHVRALHWLREETAERRTLNEQPNNPTTERWTPSAENRTPNATRRTPHAARCTPRAKNPRARSPSPSVHSRLVVQSTRGSMRTDNRGIVCVWHQ